MENKITSAGGNLQTQSEKAQLNEDYTTILNHIFDIENQNNLLHQDVFDHSSYTDHEGKTGSKPKWFLSRIKNKITEAFGKKVFEMSDKEVKRMVDLYGAIRHTITEGEQSGLTRREIKDRVYNQIDTRFAPTLGGKS